MNRERELDRRLDHIERLLMLILRLESVELLELDELEAALKARNYPRTTKVAVSQP